MHWIGIVETAEILIRKVNLCQPKDYYMNQRGKQENISDYAKYYEFADTVEDFDWCYCF